MPDPDLVQQIVDCAREKWPEADFMHISIGTASWNGGRNISYGEPSLLVKRRGWPQETIAAPDLAALLAKLKETGVKDE